MITYKLRCVFFTLISIFASFNAFCQSNLETGDVLDLHENLKNVGSAVQTSGNYAAGTAFDNRFKGTKGSPFIFEDWQIGRIDLIGYRAFTNIPLKYDAHQNKVWLLFPNDSSSFILEPELIESFELEALGQKHIFFPIAPKDFEKMPSQKWFYESLYDGKHQLIKKIQIQFIPASNGGPYAAGNTFNEFSKKETYFLKLENTELFQEVKWKSKKIKKLLKGKLLADFEQFEKENHIKVSSEKEFILFLKSVE